MMIGKPILKGEDVFMKMIAAVGLVAGVLALEATARPVRFIDYVQTDGKEMFIAGMTTWPSPEAAAASTAA